MITGTKRCVVLGQRSSLPPGAGRAEPGDRGCRCGEAVRLKLHYIDGLQLLNLPWPSAGSNVGHWGVQDEKGEGWATKIYLTKQGWSSFSHGTHGQDFATTDWPAEIEFGAQPKSMSRGQHKTQSPLDDCDVAQTGWWKETEEGSNKVKMGEEERGVTQL